MKNWLVLDVCDEERKIRISPNPEMDCACISMSMSSKGTDEISMYLSKDQLKELIASFQLFHDLI